MNLLDFTVIEVVSQPYYSYGWGVDVIAESYGVISNMTVYTKTEEEAKEIQEGYVFQA